MENQELTEQESFAIIQQMIATAKNEQHDDGKGWILWGWLLFSVSILTVINLRLRFVSTFFFWNVFSIIAIILFALIIFKKLSLNIFKKVVKTKTYTSDLFEKLNIGFFILLGFINVAMNAEVVSVNVGFAILMSTYAFWVLIYGAALNFRPSIVGAYIIWAIAFIALFIKSLEWIMFLHALAVFMGYIVPGHLANKEFKKKALNK